MYESDVRTEYCEDKNDMLRKLDLARYCDEVHFILICGDFKIVLRQVPNNAWQQCVIKARDKAVQRLRSKIRKAPASLFKARKLL